MRRWLYALGIGLALVVPARAHVGNKDVFEQVQAGPYKLFITIRAPLVIPGVATVEVRSTGAAVSGIEMTPVPLTGEAAKHPPSSDAMHVSVGDPAFFTGSLWLMAPGSWQVRLAIDGAGGAVTAGVPVAAAPLAILPMQRSLGIVLAVLGVVLALGMAGIVAAAVRESRLAPGVEATASRRRRAMVASGVTLALMAAAIALGNKWWNVEAAGYAEDIYKPLDLKTSLSGSSLRLTMGEVDEKKGRWEAETMDSFLPDHGHLMHLYAIREPEMDVAFHLHPSPVSEEQLGLTLPSMPPGEYKLFADVVHVSGFPETLMTTLTVPPGMTAAPLAADDASAMPPGLAMGELGPAYKLPDGYSMVWDRPAEIVAGTGYTFRFHLLDPAGKPATGMETYLGMAGHAAFVKADGSAFAHTHPEGSAAMPAMMLANTSMEGMMDMPVTSTVEFPYGFPGAGRFRVFIQMKRAGTVETGVFDAEVRWVGASRMPSGGL